LSLEESIAGRIVKPGIVGRATVAGLHVEGLSGQLFGVESARVGHRAGLNSSGTAVLLPGREANRFGAGLGVLDPLDDLSGRDEIDIVVFGERLIDPEEERVEHLGVVLQPGGVVEETERSTVGRVMTVEVVVEESVELLTVEDVGARINHGTTGQVLVEFGVFTTIQFVHDQFPDGVATGRAALVVTVATVGHTEVKSVWPQRDVLQWRRDRGIVKEGLLFHHGELVVTSHAQVRSAHTYDRVVGDVGEFVDDETSSSHFFGPVIDGSFRPESLVVVVRDRVNGDFMTLSVDFLNSGVVAVLMGNEERGLNVASVGVFAATVKHGVVQFDVVVVDGIVEGDHDHLWHLFDVQVGRDSGSILRAETVGQCAALRVA